MGWYIREPAASPRCPLRQPLVLAKHCSVSLFFVRSLVMTQCTATQGLQSIHLETEMNMTSFLSPRNSQ